MLWHGQNATEKTCVFGVNSPVHPQYILSNIRVLSSTAWHQLTAPAGPSPYIAGSWLLVRGDVGGRRFSVGEFHAASKTLSANGSHLNAWGFDISAAEFPQQKKTCVFGVNESFHTATNDKHTCKAPTNVISFSLSLLFISSSVK